MNTKSTVPIPPLLPLIRSLHSLSYVIFLPSGQVVDANDGFYLLLDIAVDTPIHDLPRHLIDPGLPMLAKWHTLMADGETIYHGPISFLSAHGKPCTLTGKIFRHDDYLCLIAEHDMTEVEKMLQTVSNLNEELSDNQRMLVRANRQLTREKEELERRLQ